jgi:hypothetical protein
VYRAVFDGDFDVGYHDTMAYRDELMLQIANALGIVPASRVDGTVSAGSIIVVFSVAPAPGSSTAYNAGEGTVAVKLNKMATSPSGGVLNMGPIIEVSRVDKSPIIRPAPGDGKVDDDDGVPVGTVVGAVVGLAAVAMVTGVLVARRRRGRDLEAVAAQAYMQNHRPGAIRELGNEMYTLDEASDEGGSRGGSRTSQTSVGWGDISGFLNAKRTSLQHKTSRGSMRMAEYVSDNPAALVAVPAAAAAGVAIPRPRSSSQSQSHSQSSSRSSSPLRSLSSDFDGFTGSPPSRVKRSSRNKLARKKSGLDDE